MSVPVYSTKDPLPEVLGKRWWRFWQRYPRLVWEHRGYGIYLTKDLAYIVYWGSEGYTWATKGFVTVKAAKKYIDERERDLHDRFGV